MSSDEDELAVEALGRRKRLILIVGVALVISVGFALATVYAERRVNEEDRRVERVAATVAISDSDLINDAYGRSGSIGAKFGVADDRVTVTNVDGWCISIRSEYLTSSRVSRSQ